MTAKKRTKSVRIRPGVEELDPPQEQSIRSVFETLYQTPKADPACPCAGGSPYKNTAGVLIQDGHHLQTDLLFLPWARAYFWEFERQLDACSNFDSNRETASCWHPCQDAICLFQFRGVARSSPNRPANSWQSLRLEELRRCLTLKTCGQSSARRWGEIGVGSLRIPLCALRLFHHPLPTESYFSSHASGKRAKEICS